MEVAPDVLSAEPGLLSGFGRDRDNGVLSVVIPMSEKTKPRKVAITANGAGAASKAEVTA